jgi:peroxiredoxin
LACAPDVEYTLLANFGVAIDAKFPLGGLVDPAGRAIAEDRLLGKSLLINFYTRHCAPCIKEVPKLNAIMARRNDINVLAITPDPAEEAATYTKQYGLNWPVAADASGLLFERLNVKSFPAFALVDPRGRLVATVQANQLGGEDGHATLEGIEGWLNTQLRKRSR